MDGAFLLIRPAHHYWDRVQDKEHRNKVITIHLLTPKLEFFLERAKFIEKCHLPSHIKNQFYKFQIWNNEATGLFPSRSSQEVMG